VLDDEGARKLRKTAINKSSIRINNASEIEIVCKEYGQGRLSKFNSKRDAVVSDKRVRAVELSYRPLKAKLQRMAERKTSSLIESVPCEKGYRLVKKSAVERISGYEYNEYEGYLERNPQRIRYWKNQTSSQAHHNLPKSSLTIRSHRGSRVSNSRLITFVKPLKADEGFHGYLVSSISLLTLSPNPCVFI
jgi:hypothetical protein